MGIKLRSKAGESIVEALVAILIIMLCFTMLAGAVVTSANVNKRADNSEKAFTVPEAESGTVEVQFTVDGTAYELAPKLYENNGYYYYD